MPRRITDYTLYRWRYGIGYALVGLLVAALLIFATLYVPGGLSKAEINSAIGSNLLSIKTFDPMTVIDLPYALLQRLSFMVFGITTLSIKLPSLLLALLSVVGIIFLLRSWFHDNVAIIAALIVITASQLIFASQDGTPGIMYIFLPTWLLVLSLKVSRGLNRRGFWEFLLVAVVALSLYTPLSVYIVAAMLSATILHPHLRFIAGRLSKQKLIIAGLMGMVLLGPLVAGLILDPSVGLVLLGIPQTPPDLVKNATELAHTYFDFISSGTGAEFRPIYTLPSLLLVLLGLTRLFTTKYTARSYIITSWLILLAPVILINPSKTTTTFVPVILLIAGGINVLLHRWYQLFPRNPYARVAGLLPITLLIAGMALTGIERYFYIYHYNPSAAASFSNDLSLISAELKGPGAQPMRLLVSKSEQPFYQAVAGRQDNLIIVGPSQNLPQERPLLATREAASERSLGQPTEIITNSQKDESDRLYLYRSTSE